MRKLATLLIFISCFFIHRSNAQTVVNTSFESPTFVTGNVNGQNSWSVVSGTAAVSTAKAKTGTQSINMSASAGTLSVNYIPFAGTVPGITGEVYADFWVNPTSFVTKGISINGYDLYGGSSRRIFVIEFTTDNKIRAYNGSVAADLSTWTTNTWVRISVKMDFTAVKYKVAINSVVNATDFYFREIYTPTASGTRVAGVKEFHSLHFNHLADANTATSDAAFDDLYIGANVPSGVPFTTAGVKSITVNQPAYGSVSLSPNTPTYPLNATVTATLTIPSGYINNGWTGDLSGTTLVQTLTMNDNKTIGADVIVDAANPPPKYKLTITQPLNGTISVNPLTADSMYYKEAKIITTATPGTCYAFSSWTGDISGTTPDTFRIQNNMTIGAAFALNSIPSIKRTVSTSAEFLTALGAMNPGDTVEVNDGTYVLGSLSIIRSGCNVRPIVITAKNTGGAIINGATALVFKNLQYVTFKGFVFQSANIGTGVKLENCSYCRVTGNRFNITESASCTWLYIGDTFGSTAELKSGHNRIDHNIFDGKTQVGNYIRMDGNINRITQYDTIDHNFFKNNGPRTENGQECIRVGVSTLSMSSAYAIIEYNLFQDCDGDPEIVSIKSWDNIIRFNTFQRCLGTLCLRQGSRSIAEGNYFFGEGKTALYNGSTIGCGGIRVYGKDHKVINNYFNGLTGFRNDAALTITNGDEDNNGTNTAAHHIAENLVIAFNTLAQNKSNIEIGYESGGNYLLAPVNCTIANNIVTDSLTPIIKSYSATSLAGFTFSNNIIYPTNTATVGITATSAEVTNTNPMLVVPQCTSGTPGCAAAIGSRIFRLSAASPAINAATGSYPYVNNDFEKQARPAAKDIGANEYSGDRTVTAGPLNEENVGPNGADYSFAYAYAAVLPVNLLDFTVRYTGNASQLNWKVSQEINIQKYDVEWSKTGSSFTKVGSVPATVLSTYEALHADPVYGKNYYRLKIVELDGSFSYSPVKMINRTDKAAISIYPNPSTDRITVTIDNTTAANNKIRIINASGALIKQINNASGSNNMSLGSLPAGVYMVQVINNSGEMINTPITIIK